MAFSNHSAFFPWLSVALCLLSGLAGCSAAKARGPQTLATVVVAPPPPASLKADPAHPVLLGIDVLESQGFAPLKGQRVGLLTHAAGVNRLGVSTIDVLRRAPGVKLVALYAPEHGLYGLERAEVAIADSRDPRTGLPVFSVYGATRKPTTAMLRGIDVLVIDLQDIGVRSYTFTSAMRYVMEACFEHDVAVMVLDRPNPLGGLKVDGPPLDPELMSYVGAFRVPYVHGLTIGELARMVASAPATAPSGVGASEKAREKSRLTVVPMYGWRRSMRWPDTGLRFVPTSHLVQDFGSVIGYAMVGLGCQYSGFTHGVGEAHPFRGLAFKGRPPAALKRDLDAMHLPGLRFSLVSVPGKNGKPASGVYAEVTDWDAWNPTELSFHLMRLACRLNPPNPFAKLPAREVAMFNVHVGSAAWWNALKRDGAKVDVEGFLADWRKHAEIYRQQSRRYWLYPE